MGGRGSSSGKQSGGGKSQSVQNRPPVITYREPSQQEQREHATVNVFWENYRREGEAARETNEALINGLLKSGDITAQQAESLRRQNDTINRLNGSDAKRAEEAKKRQEELERLTRRLHEKQEQREAERKRLEAKAEEARRQEEKRRKRQEAARKAAETRRRKKAEQEKDKPFDRSVWDKGLPTAYGNGGAVTSTYNRYAARRAKKFNDWWRANHPGWDDD